VVPGAATLPTIGSETRGAVTGSVGSGSLFAAAIAVTMAALTAIVTAPLVALRAIAAWLEAQRLSPNDPAPPYALAVLYAQQQRYADAL